MTKYRKKPVVIEAMQIPPEEPHGPLEAVIAWAAPSAYLSFTGQGELVVEIATAEGEMIGRCGDWIIKGIEGEFYPCKASVFEATYEAVDD